MVEEDRLRLQRETLSNGRAGRRRFKIKAAACLHNGCGSKVPPSHPAAAAPLISAGRRGRRRGTGGRRGEKGAQTSVRSDEGAAFSSPLFAGHSSSLVIPSCRVSPGCLFPCSNTGDCWRRTRRRQRLTAAEWASTGCTSNEPTATSTFFLPDGRFSGPQLAVKWHRGVKREKRRRFQQRGKAYFPIWKRSFVQVRTLKREPTEVVRLLFSVCRQQVP